MTVVVGQDSYLTILGKTNINKFSCVYQGNFPRDTFQVQLIQMDDEVKIKDVQLQLKVDNFDCGNKVMNNDFQELLKHQQFPLISIEVLRIKSSLPDKPEKDVYGMAEVKFHIAGESNIYTLPVYLRQLNSHAFYVGTHQLDITDFNITPPTKFLGMVKVDEEVAIEFGLNLEVFDN